MTITKFADPATRPSAGLPGRLTALLLMKLLSEGLSRQKTAAKSLLILAGPAPLRRCALPGGPKNAHSGAFNRGFQVETITRCGDRVSVVDAVRAAHAFDRVGSPCRNGFSRSDPSDSARLERGSFCVSQVSFHAGNP